MSQGEYFYSKVLETIKKFDDVYAVVEIGTDRGTTAFLAMKAIADAISKKWFFTIDPYGNKPYLAGDTTYNSQMGYNDNAYRITQSELKAVAQHDDVNHVHWKLTSSDFMKIIDQVCFWSNGTCYQDIKYCFVYLDGDHHWSVVGKEFEWFYKKMPSGGVISIDDYNLLGGEEEVRRWLGTYDGKWFFNQDDGHCRCYFTKA